MRCKAVWIGFFVTMAFVSITAGLFFVKPAFRGHVIDSPRPLAEISMADDDGNLFHLSQMRGWVVVLFFGYTRCPDQCPLTLANLKQALTLLGDTAQKVQVVLVSTDPAHDSPQVLNRYLNLFNPTFRGITGSPNEMTKIYKNYSVVVLDDGATHSTHTYVIDQSGQLRVTFLPDTSPEDIAHDLNILLSER